MGLETIGLLISNGLKPDLVVDKINEYRYEMYLDSSKIVSNDSNIEDQPCWRIAKIEVETVGDDTCYRTLFPGGSMRYDFIASEAKNYTYNYAK